MHFNFETVRRRRELSAMVYTFQDLKRKLHGFKLAFATMQGTLDGLFVQKKNVVHESISVHPNGTRVCWRKLEFVKLSKHMGQSKRHNSKKCV